MAGNDNSWIIAGDGGWVSNLLKGCIRAQNKVLEEFTEDEKRKGYGFACKLIVEGDEGGVFNLWFCQEGIQPKPDDIPLRTTVAFINFRRDDGTMQDGAQTLIDIVTPDYSSMIADTPNGLLRGMEALAYLVEHYGLDKIISQLRPRETFGHAYSNHKIVFGGQFPDIDSAMWGNILDKVLYEIAFPLVVLGLAKSGSGKKKKK